jgi:hypothetical protein
MVEHLGTHWIVGVRLDDVAVWQEAEQEESSIMISIGGYSTLQVDERAHISIDTSEAILFEAETGNRIRDACPG